MEQRYKYIESLMEKFFEGETSNAEEKELYHFFSEDNIPEYLKKYKIMFQYFEHDLKEEILNNEFSEEEYAIASTINIKKGNTLLNRWLLAIAASFLLIFGAKSYLEVEKFNPYEGSYIIRNGVVIEDRAELEAEQERIEQLIDEKLAYYSQIVSSSKQKIEDTKSIEDKLLQKIENITNNDN